MRYLVHKYHNGLWHNWISMQVGDLVGPYGMSLNDLHLVRCWRNTGYGHNKNKSLVSFLLLLCTVLCKYLYSFALYINKFSLLFCHQKKKLRTNHLINIVPNAKLHVANLQCLMCRIVSLTGPYHILLSWNIWIPIPSTNYYCCWVYHSWQTFSGSLCAS